MTVKNVVYRLPLPGTYTGAPCHNMIFFVVCFSLQKLSRASSASSLSSLSTNSSSDQIPGSSTNHFSEKFKLPSSETSLPGQWKHQSLKSKIGLVFFEVQKGNYLFSPLVNISTERILFDVEICSIKLQLRQLYPPQNRHYILLSLQKILQIRLF